MKIVILKHKHPDQVIWVFAVRNNLRAGYYI